MKYITLVFAILILSSSRILGQESDSNNVNINTSQPDILINLMYYIRDTYGAYAFKDLNVDSISKNIEINKKDKILKEKIENLLSHPVYDYFSNNVRAFDKDKTIFGKDAYRLAFSSLPWLTIDMSSGLIGRITEYFSKGNEEFLLSLIKQINENKKSYRDTIFTLVSNLLPSNCLNNGTVNIYFAIDGNRGSFADSNYIVMELIGLKEENLKKLIFSSAHEMHHICYGNWLSENFSNKPLNPNEKEWLEWQYRIIFEGSAQLCNYHMYPEKTKELYYNKELVLELYNYWVKSIDELENSQYPEKEYKKINECMYNELGEQLLKRYSDKNYKELFPYRPTVDYYLGYHLYKTIYDKQGKEGLYYVLLNPQMLLQIFNETRNEDSIVPEIPSELVNTWKSSLEKARRK
jgi:hypothetical protein